MQNKNSFCHIEVLILSRKGKQVPLKHCNAEEALNPLPGSLMTCGAGDCHPLEKNDLSNSVRCGSPTASVGYTTKRLRQTQCVSGEPADAKLESRSLSIDLRNAADEDQVYTQASCILVRIVCTAPGKGPDWVGQLLTPLGSQETPSNKPTRKGKHLLNDNCGNSQLTGAHTRHACSTHAETLAGPSYTK